MSLTMTTLGRNGRLGNQLFQMAGLVGLAHRFKTSIAFNKWKYSPAFGCEFLGADDKIDKIIEEKDFHFNFDQFNEIANGGNIDVKGYLQSEKYWCGIEHHIKHLFEFKKQFVIDCLRQFPHAFEKKTIAIHIRRGDYVNNKNYLNLSIPYYMCTLQDHFPDWRNMNLIFFSDDMKYVKANFGCLENAYFSEHNSDIEDLCLMSQCDNFILSNSTFAWWAAWIGEKHGTKIVRPDEYFSGNLKLRCDDKDLWPERWAVSHVNKKINLQDATFMIPVTYDHEDRKKNVELTVKFLRENFDTTVTLAEQGKQHFNYMLGKCNYYHCPAIDVFHRTKILNMIACVSKTPIIFNWDADIIMSPLQVLEAVQKIRDGADVVYPYDGRFAKVPRSPWFDRVAKNLDVSQLSGIAFSGLEKDRRASVGGAVAFNKESYWKGGGENENYISYGPEDRERFYRFTTLGFKVERVKGVLYHMNHFKGKDSRPLHENHNANMVEHAKIKGMDADQLREYVKTWVR